MTVLSRVREWSQVPVVILSARGHEADKVEALNEGRTTTLTKPFGVPELLARVRVALRHSARVGEGAGEGGSRYEAGDLVVDLAARRVALKGDGRASHPHRVPAVGPVRQERRQGADSPLPAAGGVGPGLRAADALSPHVRGHASA